jgi:hypothetical protein
VHAEESLARNYYRHNNPPLQPLSGEPGMRSGVRLARERSLLDLRLNGSGEFGERVSNAPVGAGVDAQLVVTAPEVLYERVTAHDHAGAVVGRV